MGLRGLLSLLLVVALARSAAAQITVPNADDTDGAFSPVVNVQVDLSLADTVSFADFQMGVNPNPGQGVYIPEQWAVVFRYSSVNIPSGVTVTFSNHPSLAPVVWLVSGNVTISGVVNLSGGNGHPFNTTATQSLPGPGGFRGGRGRRQFVASSAGFGPGGAGWTTWGILFPPGASHFSGGGSGSGTIPIPPTYGNSSLLPLRGGSGGAGSNFDENVEGGGAGGGAILIAATQSVTINGGLYSYGGNYGGHPHRSSGGSGGSIRVVSDNIMGSGYVYALGGAGASSSNGGIGRIRIEGNNISLVSTTPPASQAIVGATAQIWPSASIPALRVLSIGGAAAPDDPYARLNLPSDIQLSDPFPVTVVIEATNMPLDWTVNLRTVPITGADINTPATFASGDATLSTWEAEVQLTNGFSVMQARAVDPNP